MQENMLMHFPTLQKLMIIHHIEEYEIVYTQSNTSIDRPHPYS